MESIDRQDETLTSFRLLGQKNSKRVQRTSSDRRSLKAAICRGAGADLESSGAASASTAGLTGMDLGSGPHLSDSPRKECLLCVCCLLCSLVEATCLVVHQLLAYNIDRLWRFDDEECLAVAALLDHVNLDTNDGSSVLTEKENLSRLASNA
jgi:hypothetical protein